MDHNLKLAARIFFSACILLVLSCNKILDIKDLVHRHDDDKLCKISKITTSFYATAPNPLIAQFAYNKNGDPVSISFNFVATGHPNLVFRYDKYGRLSDYIGMYLGSGYEFWYHYQYKDNRIVSDTLYFFGYTSGDTLYPGMYPQTEKFKYDKWGRISQVDLTYLYAPGIQVYPKTYNYDNNGNLIRSYPTNIAYDNKVNIRRASDVWMFLDRDYSVNNPGQATSYNPKKLPLGFNMAATDYTRFISIDISNSAIEYQCDNDNKKD